MVDHSDDVVLIVPARPSAIRVARAVVSDVCDRLGFSPDEAEDLRLAVEEMCGQLVGLDGRSGQLTLRLRPLARGVEVRGEIDDPSSAAGFGPTHVLSERLVAALVDEYDRLGVDGRLRVRLVKRGRTAGAERLAMGVADLERRREAGDPR